jgi:histidyl-tRNA synthetase
MTNRPQNIKGMRDHLPEAMILRQYILSTLISVFERHGFEPLQTPLIEHAATLEGKIGDEERLIYRFETHGGDKVALRYDQTVPLARVVGQYQGKLTFPWRRYAIGQSYRGERPARGRYREFWQADVDIVGSASPVADAEIISTLTDALGALGFSGFTTLLNHRQVIGGIARVAGLDEERASSVYRAIDKLDKIGPDGVRAELARMELGNTAIDRIMEIILIEGSPDDVLEELSERLAGDERAQSALENLRQIIANLQSMGVAPERFAVSPRLARGLSYYTGSVFESVVENPPMGSLLGGGRYDELVGMFTGQPVPTVGLAFGIERLHDVMEELGMGPGRRTVSDVFITIFSPETAGASLRLASELRAAGLNVETALEPGDKLGRQLKYADARGVPLALVVGPDELARDEVVLKDLRSGEQHSLRRELIVDAIRGARTGGSR